MNENQIIEILTRIPEAAEIGNRYIDLQYTKLFIGWGVVIIIIIIIILGIIYSER